MFESQKNEIGKTFSQMLKLRPRACDLPKVTYLVEDNGTQKDLLTPNCYSVSHC